MSRGTFLLSLRRLLSPVSHSKLIIHKLFYPYLSLLPNPPTFIHVRSFFSPPYMALCLQLHFKLQGYTLSSISLGYINGGMPGKGIKLLEKMHSKTPMDQFIPAALFFFFTIMNILQALDWHDKAILMPGLG